MEVGFVLSLPGVVVEDHGDLCVVQPGALLQTPINLNPKSGLQKIKIVRHQSFLSSQIVREMIDKMRQKCVILIKHAFSINMKV